MVHALIWLIVWQGIKILNYNSNKDIVLWNHIISLRPRIGVREGPQEVILKEKTGNMTEIRQRKEQEREKGDSSRGRIR